MLYVSLQNEYFITFGEKYYFNIICARIEYTQLLSVFVPLIEAPGIFVVNQIFLLLGSYCLIQHIVYLKNISTRICSH